MRNKVSNLLRQIAAALMMAAFLSPAVWAAPAPSGRPQKLASPDSVPDGLSAPDWSSIRQQYEQHRHAAFPVDGGYQARNPGQQWQTRFDRRGFTTKPEGAAWQWGLELLSYGFPGHERSVAGQPRVNTAGQRVTYDWDATLQEWFVNDRHGLEHGFTVRERPPTLECADWSALWLLADSSASEGAFSDRLPAKWTRHATFDGDKSPAESGDESPHSKSALAFTLAVRGGLRPEVQADGRGVRFLDAQGAAALTYSELTVLDADGRELPAWFQTVTGGATVLASRTGLVETRLVSSLAPPENPADIAPCLRLVIDERGARYPLTIDPIAQQAYLKASNTGGAFGISVAVAGHTVVVGVGGDSSNATGVDGDPSDTSAPGAGAACVFVRSGSTWSQQAYLKASNTEERDSFGYSVAVSGDTVVVGAYGEDSSATGVDGDGSDNSVLYAGAAYVFVRNGTTWTQQAYLKASNTGDDSFGQSVAVSGDTVVVGALGEDSGATGVDGDQNDNSAESSGAAYVFVRNGTTWTQQAYLKASNTGGRSPQNSLGDLFGCSVSVSGDTAVVGAMYESSNTTGVDGNQSDNSVLYAGAAYVFARSGTNWAQQAYLKASNTDAGDIFGTRVAVAGDTVVVGAEWEDSNATGVNGNQSSSSAPESGAAYVFVRNGITWTQQAYLKASNTDTADFFGSSVAVSGDTVVVGAHEEDSSARGANGNQGNNSAVNSGAAYVFVRSGMTWSQQTYLKASNTGVEDAFGLSVAVSGDTTVVGAYREDSNATGVNGNQSDNSAGDSGAAYSFSGVGIGPRLALVPDGGGYFLRFTGVPDVTYRLQRAPSVTGPWSALVTNTAPASGLIEYHETTPPPGSAFYRTVQP